MRLQLVPPIHRATHRIGLYLATLSEDGLSQGEAHILALLATAGPSTIADLHKGLAHKRSTLTSILDRLADRGLITRAVGTADRRTFVVTPTAKGRRVAERVHAHLADLERTVASHLSANDLRVFVKVITAVEEEAHRRASQGSGPAPLRLTVSRASSTPARTRPRSQR
jgi:DNA-binding MarR family transcriptional regulator